ncbi:MAG: lysophospholipid acyltransferase family protein [Pseudomonadota bacterium]
MMSSVGVMLFKALSKLPLPILYGVSTFVYLIVYYIAGYRRNTAYKNLQNSFPDKSEAELQQLAKQFYRNLSDITLESVKSISIQQSELERRVKFTNPEVLNECFEQDQSVILMTMHQCNWEWLLLAASAKLPKPVAAIYKPLHNPKIDVLMREIRSRFGAELIPAKQTMVEVMRRKKEGPHCLAIVADQLPGQDEETYWAHFLNQDTAFAVGTEKVAKIARAPVFFVKMVRTGRGFYEVTLEKMVEPPYPKKSYFLIEKYVEMSEQHILQYPSDWLWSYRKWKYKKPLYA